MKARFIVITILILAMLGACSGPAVKRSTLREVDVVGTKEVRTGKFKTPKSDEDIRKAYAEYLEHASKNDKSRINALNRLAELEFELSEQILKNKNNQGNDVLDDKLYNAKLDRTIELLNTSLRDYPDAEGNDQTLYQLAKAYDQKGEYDKSRLTLEKIVKKYPKSRYYIESQFRLAEDAFSSKKYTIAEDIYTGIIGSRKNNVFYEKSLYKRGWSRFKQEFYIEAVDDFLQVVKYNKFNDYDKLGKSKKNLFDEYFRAIGLSFSYMGGAEPLNEYFKTNGKFRYLYYTYAHVSDVYVKQERYSDAVNTLNYFARQNPKSDHVPEAYLKAISIWKSGGFSDKMNAALAPFYAAYHPDSAYWHNKKKVDPRIYKLVKTELKNHILTVTANHHKRFLLTKKHSDFKNAYDWYNKYLDHYSAYAKKDNIHYLLGTLLAENRNYKAAIQHFEQAAFDSNLIINNDAAYESIILASRLASSSQSKQETSQWLGKLIHYSTLYSQQNTTDKRTNKIIAHASELAYKNNMFSETVALTELIAENDASLVSTNINTIKAHSYFKLNRFEDAEATYLDILENRNLPKKYRTPAVNGLAISIYYQGKKAEKNNGTRQATEHYARIIKVAPGSSVASTGMYDAIALSMKNELWDQAISYMKSFQRLYPSHKYSHDVAKKLSVAYLNSKQDIAAARELEQISKNENDQEYRRAALWKAGELYESKQEYRSAIRSYEEYARNFSRPFPQYMESMAKLIELYTAQNDQQRITYWQKRVLQADKKAPTTLRTDRTRLIASRAALDLAKDNYAIFTRTKLVHPLKQNLRRKKHAMQQTVNLYGRASSYGVAETTTEATHAIAEIYNEFSKALLQSERPRHLNNTELEQYEILLEDQAFPFEEKAIEFYETNLVHVKDNVYDEWVRKSHAQLKQLFPVRYQREAKLEGYINVLH